MSLYETTLIIRQDMSTAEVEKLADDLAAIVTQGGGKIKQREYWGLRSLAYRINKSKKGHYVYLGMDAPSDAVKAMEQKIRYTEDVMRSLTVKVEKLPEGPTPVMQKDRDQEAA